MAGSVLIRTFSFQINISAKMKVSASKSATSPSCKTLPPMVKDDRATLTMTEKFYSDRRFKALRLTEKRATHRQTQERFNFCPTALLKKGTSQPTNFLSRFLPPLRLAHLQVKFYNA
ncbi:MAG: hypothetical protein HUU47_11135 [Bacteroidetes bacterium]|nr:hypothetical protein [Bacteroidota bacterium]